MEKWKIKNFYNTRLGLFALVAVLIWLKNILAYTLDFNLKIENAFEYFILLINPIASTLFLLTIALYVRGKKTSYITMMTIYFSMTLLIFSNITYYREFTDFITVNTLLGSGKVASGLGESAIRLFRPHDILYWIDFIVLAILLVAKKIKMETKPVRAKVAVSITLLSALCFSVNLTLAETARTGLLTRQFSRDYIVKFLGINAFTVYDGINTYKTNQVRAEASANDMETVANYVSEHYAAPDPEMFGIAKGKNVIYIHLESFQQFLIDYSLTDSQGTEHVVTPFINSLYHSNSTYSFDNFFHQVGQGKTSDAETLLENSLFGLNQGSLFTQVGGKNTFEAAPAILKQEADYTSAVFHGNTGNFWNRNETYKHLGYDYFFDASYYDVRTENSFQYGLHDKPFFQQSVQYLEHLQQPFYSKFIAVSNHYPYSQFTNEEAGFPIATTSDETINGYFATANYLDKSVEEFFNYLKSSGLYENSVIVLYGDHYGISSSRNQNLADLVGKSKATWTDFDNSAMQRVPYMIHIPGETNGKINHTYGAQVDALPTLLHLMGVDTKNYIQLGQDLFSKENEQLVAFRNGNYVTPNYTMLGSTVYETATGELIEEPTQEQIDEVTSLKEKVRSQLKMSDQTTNGDLLRFHTGSGLTPINLDEYSYKNQLEKLLSVEKAAGSDSTSVFSTNKNISTIDSYFTDSYQGYLKESQ